MDRVKVLDAYIDNLGLNEIIIKIRGFIKSGKPHAVITANSLMVNCITSDTSLKKAFKEADLVVADSIGIIWAAAYLGNPICERIPGIDLMIKLCETAEKENFRIYLLGAHDEIVKKAAESLQARFSSLDIAGTHNGYFTAPPDSDEEKEVIRSIKELRPDMLFVGMAIAIQERWINEHIYELGVPVCMGIGGSFDVLSGRLNRAPLWFRRIGLEWIYRFFLQPWRFVRLLKLPVFVFKVFIQKHIRH